MKKVYYWYRQRLLPQMIAKCVKFFVRLIGMTLHYEIKGEKPFLADAAKNGCILLFWHNRITLLLELFTLSPEPVKFAALISNSRDGEIIASVCESYCKDSAIRVRHQAKFAALKKAVDCIEKEKKILAITPDGPKGPRYKIKKGVALAASTANCPVYSLSWCPTRFWQFPSWDGLLIPYPFSTVHVDFSCAHFSKENEDLIEELEKSMRLVDKKVEKRANALVV